MVKQLMSAAAASDDGEIALKNFVRKIYNSRFVLFNTRNSVILKQTLKARNHFVRLGNGILIRIQFIFIGKLKNIFAVRSAALYYIRRKIEIFFFPCYGIQSDNRFKN